MPNITDNVSFDTIAREWRCKWDSDNDKKSLTELQSLIESVLAEVKAVDGVQSVQRIVCGGCHDFKIIVALAAETFIYWEEKGFAPETDFIAKMKEIAGMDNTYMAVLFIFSFITIHPCLLPLSMVICNNQYIFLCHRCEEGGDADVHSYASVQCTPVGM